ncbi:golgin subfamily A member 6-like protein 24 isoform X3 [Lineus longissimus]|uniref:golgin subfamily A member 6-like protein 24 isoform X3 n=1 Tax=Lineus longissimus TaxID=88925 RepID=UPI002B4DBBE3
MSKSQADVPNIKEITRKLTEDGLDARASVEEKLLHLWQLYLESQASLKATLENIEELRQQQAQEMQEVENYVEHIRQLSDEREALTLEFETENEQLKGELEQLRHELAGFQNEETAEMLIQQGLDDIAKSSNSEQIAYLLVERARLMDELELEQHRSRSRPASRADDANLTQMMEKERAEFEEELRQQRDSMQQLKEHMHQVHEEELENLKEEKEKMVEDLDQASKQINNLQIQLNNLSVDLEQEKQSANYKIKSMEANVKNAKETELCQLQDENKRLESELLAARGQVKDLVKNNEAFQESLRELNTKYEKEREENNNRQAEFDNSISEFASKSDDDHIHIQELKSSISLLTDEKNSLGKKVESLEREINELQEKEESLLNKSESIQNQDSLKKYKDLCVELGLEKKEALEVLNETQDVLKEEIENSANLQERLALADEKAEECDQLREQARVLKIRKAALEEQLLQRDESNQQQTEGDKSQIAKLESKLEKLRKQIEEKDIVLSERSDGESHEIVTLKQQLVTLQEEVVAKETCHKQQLEEERARVRELEDYLTDYEDQYKEEMKAKRKNVKNLQAELEGGAQLQKELEDKVASLEEELKDSSEKSKEHIEAKRQLEQKLTSAGSHEKTADETKEQISLLEKALQQVESDNNDLAKKYSDSIAQYQELEKQLRSEKETSCELKVRLEAGESEQTAELQQLEKEVTSLRAELIQRKSHITKLESEVLGSKSDQERELNRLKQQNEQLQTSHKKEIENLAKNLEKSYKDLSDSRATLREREEETIHLKHRMNVDGREATHKLEMEVKLRHDFEKRNQILEEELNKQQSDPEVWNQLREKMDQVANMEKAKENLEEELDRKSITCRNTETKLAQRSLDQSTALQEANRRLEESEEKISSLQHDLHQAVLKLESSERQVRDITALRGEVQRSKDEVIHLRSQLQEEKLNRTLEAQHTEELRKHMALLKEKETRMTAQNRELQHMLLDMENKMSKVQDQSRSASSMQNVVENAKQTLADQVAKLQKEIETQQLELLASSDRYDNQVRRYEDRKAMHKTKLQRAREIYNREKSRLREYIYKLEEELRLSKMSLDKEVEFKEKTVDDYKMLMKEKRELLSRLSEEEERAKDKTRLSSMLQVRCKFLEEENSGLQDRVELVQRQKQEAEKTLKDRRDKAKEALRSLTPLSTVQTPRSMTPLTPMRSLSPVRLNSTGITPHSTMSSGLGLSIDSSWDNNILDAVLTMQSAHKNGIFGRSYERSSSFDGLDD